eukprot:CAMPEP_0184008540 /NCGR_PEP_ID=MMETSP0954-20121128/2038_1 /TAXON_ID=627963 /ORGANISM="Aplanochytrium sp, Strain PBS07" /LENGTH=989 /DNA_ID=CAMNT_0026287677 /DNA_START=524 /DNA_END=3493 /DNA_ORIENTATION=+
MDDARDLDIQSHGNKFSRIDKLNKLATDAEAKTFRLKLLKKSCDRLLDRFGLFKADPELRKQWCDTLVSLSENACQYILSETESPAEFKNINSLVEYVRVVPIPGGGQSSCAVLPGVLQRKCVSHRKMSSHIENPRIMILRGGIEFPCEGSSFASLEVLHEREREFMAELVNRIVQIGVDVLLVENSVSREFQELLLGVNITLILKIKKEHLVRIARMTNSKILSSVKEIVEGSAVTGSCDSFDVEKYLIADPERSNQEACQSIENKYEHFVVFLGNKGKRECTIKIRGASKQTLLLLKDLLEMLLLRACWATCEDDFLADIDARMHPQCNYQTEIDETLSESLRLLEIEFINFKRMQINGIYPVAPPETSLIELYSKNANEYHDSLAAFIVKTGTSMSKNGPEQEQSQPPSVQIVYFNGPGRVKIQFKILSSAENGVDSMKKTKMLALRRSIVSETMQRVFLDKTRETEVGTKSDVSVNFLLVGGSCNVCGSKLRTCALGKNSSKIPLGRFLMMWLYQKHVRKTPDTQSGCDHSILQNYTIFFECFGIVAFFRYETTPIYNLTMKEILLTNKPSLEDPTSLHENKPTALIAYALRSKIYRVKFRELGQAGATNDFDACDSVEKIQSVLQYWLEIGSPKSESQLEMSFARSESEDPDIPETETFEFKIKIHYPLQFHALRNLYFSSEQIGFSPCDRFLQSMSQCSRWNPSGGKTNALFFKTDDDRFLMKTITIEELEMFHALSNNYFMHMKESLIGGMKSVLMKILGIFTITTKNTGNASIQPPKKHHFLLMEKLYDFAKDEDSDFVLFDLKGNIRNRYVSNPMPNSVLLDVNFLETTGGIPLTLTESSKKYLKTAIQFDTLMLQRAGIVDYSLLVCIRKKIILPKTIEDTKKEDGNQGKQDCYVLRIGIVDYLQLYNYKKIVESSVKRAAMLAGQLEPTVIEPSSYRNRFLRSMDQYFISYLPTDKYLSSPESHLEEVESGQVHNRLC